MRARKNAKKQTTPAKKVASRANEVRARLEKRGINERDIAAAVSLARKMK